MPIISGVIIDNGITKTTSYTGNVTNKNQSFTFNEKQNGMIFTNDGLSEITLNANGRTYIISGGETIGIEFELSSFNVVRKTVGIQTFSLTSYLFHSGTGQIPNIPNPNFAIEDNLTSFNIKSALSANQGRILSGLKADKTYVDGELVKKANATDLTTKANQTDLNTTNTNVSAANQRIDALIISSGNANVEVTDAHVSTTKNKTFTTVRNRMEEVETDVLNNQKNLDNNRNILIANNAISQIASSTGTVAMPSTTVEGLPIAFTANGSSSRVGNAISNVNITSITTKKNNIVKESASLNLILRGLANGIKDTLSEKGEVNRRVGTLTLNGSESGWILDTAGTNISRFTIPLANAKGYNGQNLLSDLFPYNDIAGSVADTNNTEFIKFSSATNNLFLGISVSKLSTNNLAGFKSWLSSNNLNIAYELKDTAYTKESVTLPAFNGYQSGEFNIVSSVAPSITSYIPLKKEVMDFNQKNNLSNGVYRSDLIVTSNLGVSTIITSSTGNARSIVIPLEPNKSYSILVKGAHNSFCLALTNNVQNNSPMSRLNTYLGSRLESSFSFTNTDGYAYLMVTVSTISQEPKLIVQQDSEIPKSDTKMMINSKPILLRDDSFDLTTYKMKKYESYFISDDMQGTVYATYSDVYAAYDTLVTNFPGYVTKVTLGQDAKGNNMIAYKFSKPTVNNNMGLTRLKFGISSGVHGNEQNPVYTLQKFMELLCNNPYGNEMIDRIKSMVDFYILPICNPTGYNANTRENWNGVNLNRNFTTAWLPTNQTDSNSGTGPASESETKLIESWMATNLFDYYIDFHDTSQVGNVFTWLAASSTDNGKELKRYYFKAVSLLSGKWSDRFSGFPKNTMFGETTAYNTLAQAWVHCESTGAKSCLLEVPWQITFSDNVLYGAVTNTCTIEMLGNMIFNICRGYI